LENAIVRRCHYSQIPSAVVVDNASTSFDKFYFIPGFFTLSLSLAFFIDFSLVFMVIKKQL